MNEATGEEHLDLSTEASPSLNAAAEKAKKALAAEEVSDSPLPSLDAAVQQREASLALTDGIAELVGPYEELFMREAIELDLAHNVSRGIFAPRKKNVADYTLDHEGGREYPYTLSYTRNKEGIRWELTPTQYQQALRKGSKFFDYNGLHPDRPRLNIEFDKGKIISVGLDWYLIGSANAIGGRQDPPNYEITDFEGKAALKTVLHIPEFTNIKKGGWQTVTMEFKDKEHPRLVYTTDQNISNPRIDRAEYIPVTNRNAN